MSFIMLGIYRCPNIYGFGPFVTHLLRIKNVAASVTLSSRTIVISQFRTGYIKQHLPVNRQGGSAFVAGSIYIFRYGRAGRPFVIGFFAEIKILLPVGHRVIGVGTHVARKKKSLVIGRYSRKVFIVVGVHLRPHIYRVKRNRGLHGFDGK